MTYQFVKEQTLRLLNRLTMAGAPVSPVYNNQQDYLSRIPGLINDAMLEIATTVRKLPVLFRPDPNTAEDLGRELRIAMPDDFFQFQSGGTVLLDTGRLLSINAVRTQGRTFLLIPKQLIGGCTVVYYRYPRLLPDNPADETELDGTPETHYALPYYAAAMLAAHDDPYLCSLLMNRYTDKLQKLLPDITAEPAAVQDAYAFHVGGDVT